MHIRKAVILSLAGASLFTISLKAQNSSINTFNPYTLYGIGDFSTKGPANLRSMGGIGVAFRDSHLDPYMANYNNLNPASYSSVPRRAFLFNFELEGENYYLKDANTKTTYNTFNIRDVGISFPLAKNLGFGFSVSPYSSVGYRMEAVLDDRDILADIGEATVRYTGEGDINQYKFGIGYQLFRNFSLGAEMIYYHGYLDRQQRIIITSITGGGNIGDTKAHMTEKVSRMMMMAGFQYDLINTNRRVLTLGGTYNMGGKLNSKKEQYIPADSYGSDTIFHSYMTSNVSLANTYTAGLFYQTAKIGVGLDYAFADWRSSNKGIGYAMSGGGYARYNNTNSVKAGFEITPNRYDFRRYMNRISYRVGVRYEDYYMSFNGKKINEAAVTMGFGIPVRMGVPSFINVGLEYGRQGTTGSGMVRANFFKFSIGLTLFGEDYWFVKQKYD
ncbi:MAG: hypothetical protein LUE26_04030 [Alistipes sp.]|nr:hypothetical protein [Alistipes sp.]